MRKLGREQKAGEGGEGFPFSFCPCPPTLPLHSPYSPFFPPASPLPRPPSLPPLRLSHLPSLLSLPCPHLPLPRPLLLPIFRTNTLQIRLLFGALGPRLPCLFIMISSLGSNPPCRWIVNFDVDFMDGLVLAALVAAHVPFVVSRNYSLQPVIFPTLS